MHTLGSTQTGIILCAFSERCFCRAWGKLKPLWWDCTVSATGETQRDVGARIKYSETWWKLNNCQRMLCAHYFMYVWVVELVACYKMSIFVSTTKIWITEVTESEGRLA